MIAVVTGTVGIDKKQYLQQVCQIARENGNDITLCNVGDMMYQEAPDIGPGRILDVPLQRLRSLRRTVVKDIITKARSGENIIINTHATFRWRHGLFRAFDFDQMRQLNADIYICMVDSADALHVRLCAEHSLNHSLKDLLVWREEEAIATELMKEGVNPNALFYCLARGENDNTTQTCYRLIFEPQRKKTYLSFPMTHVMDMPDILEEIASFRTSMKNLFTCFDPGDLEEAYLPFLAQRAAAEGKEHLDVTVFGKKVRFGIAEIMSVETDISSQTYTRDFALIDQADMIISYIPHLGEGRAAISSGVERELQHAHEAGKEVYVIWPSPNPPSVFVTQTATKVFSSLQDAKEYFNHNA